MANKQDQPEIEEVEAEAEQVQEEVQVEEAVEVVDVETERVKDTRSKAEKDQIADIWKRAGKNEPLTGEEFELYVKEVERRRQ